MARVNIDILGISELKWTGMGEFNSDDHYIYYCGQESLGRNGVVIIVNNKRVRNAVLWCNLKTTEWTIKKAECRRIDAFELWSWRRLLRVPWTARRSNQSILKEVNPEYSLEGLMLKLKLQYFGHLMWRTDSFEKTLMLGKTEGGRRRGQQRMR